MLYYGLGTEKNEKEAFDIFTRCANQGNAEARYHLGKIYYGGAKDIKRDFAMARTWFMSAAASGSKDALYYLGRMEYRGEGEKRDTLSAFVWLSLARERGAEEGKKELAILTKTLTARQKEQAQELITQYREKYVTPFTEDKPTEPDKS
ncbi:MAG: sel1 repeat family protein [Alphaproteobacteria bacterium]|nr:sel1 repeat family protein [Alphaproteobacteria bacterium]